MPDHSIGLRHLAIIMDGNGRWAKQRHLPRVAGHRAGRQALRRVVEACLKQQIQALTVFAFGRENWQRPGDEVRHLMKLFEIALNREVHRLHDNQVRVQFIGELSGFSPLLQQGMAHAVELTRHNRAMTLTIAVNYSGQWDITQASQRLAALVAAGQLAADDITPEKVAQQLMLHHLPPPDLLIRSSGEQRLSNFLLWQLAYTELYFTQRLWPDFDAEDIQQACQAFAKRERRHGQTSAQRQS